MESKSIIRNVDDLGRIVLPLELRKILEINPREQVKLPLQDNGLFLEKAVLEKSNNLDE